MRRWISRLQDHGIKIQSGEDAKRLTHVRFADDIIVYAHSLEELCDMMDLLADELQKVGLELYVKKEKHFQFGRRYVHQHN